MTAVLVDTSVWRKFFAGAVAVQGLAALLEGEETDVLVHPFVVGELVLGGLSPREEALFSRLPGASLVPHGDVLAFARTRGLARRGIGWVDAHLLASALTSPARLWSTDRALSAAAVKLSVAFRPESA